MRSLGVPLLVVFTLVATGCENASSTPSPTSASAVGQSALSAKGGGRQVDTPVTSDLGGPGNQVQGDGTPYQDGSSGVSSIIQTSNTCCNDWLVNTDTTAGHGIRVDFSRSAGGTNPFSSAAFVPQDAGIIVQCHDAYPASFPAMTPGGGDHAGAYNCPMVVHFHSADTIGDRANTYWKVAMGAGYYPNLLNTGLATVTCTQPGTSGWGCSQWTVQAVDQQASLIRVATNGNGTSFGNFLMTFSFTVTK